MGTTRCKNPNALPTSRQTWAVFCMTGQDIRDCGLTREEVSAMIGALKTKGEYFLPEGKTYGDGEDFICTKAKLRETANGLWAKSGRSNPMTVKAVVASKKSKPKKNTSWATDLLEKAHEAGQKALEAIKPKVAPMVVEQHVDQLDDNSPVAQSWVVEGGPCGFAFVRVKCTNGPSRKFISELKKKGLAGDQNSFKDWSKSDYYGGFLYSFTMVGGQSLAYKEAYAGAFTNVLLNAGLDAYMFSRMD